MPRDDLTRTDPPGVVLARGVCRHLLDLGFAPVTEFVPARGLRADVFAVGPTGEIWIVECKSGLADFRSDRKWPGYLAWCDRFLFAVDADFPQEVLPPETGLLLADGWGAEILRPAPEAKLAPARRKALVLRAARAAATRLRLAVDPGAPALSDL
ncbi:MAG: MmcB family DNA repair protein [Paracoccaceae bacterium]